MQKTLLVTIDFPPMFGGVASYWSNLAKCFPPDNFMVLAPDFDRSLDFDMEQSYLIYRKKLLSKSKWVWPKWLPLLIETYKIVRREKIRYLIVTHVLPAGTVVWILKKLLNVKYIVSLHGLDISLAANSERKKRIAKMILQGSDSILVNSNYTKMLLGEKLCKSCAEKAEEVYPCPNIVYKEIAPEKIEQFKQKNGIEGNKIVLTVGRLIERKGQSEVIKAISHIQNSISDVTYIVVGGGSEKEHLKELTRSLKLNDRVLFFDDIQDEELPYFYHMADVFIMPVKELADGDVEGFGIVYLEANAYGLPVIAGKSGGAQEAVEHGLNGLLVDANNSNEVSQALISLLTNKEKAKQLGENGRRRQKEIFTWRKQVSKILEILK